VLERIDFAVKQGEVVAIVGASGAGKTTLVNLLARFYEPGEGRILFDGQDIAKASLLSVRRQIGLVTQDVLLFDDTVRANIAYGDPRPDPNRILGAARAAHVEEFVSRMPEGFDTVIGEGGSMLSGGQRQRLAIARAIYKDPAILILDEATSSLDTESESYIREALDEFVKGRTTFVIAHRLATVERADRIIVLDYGRIEAVGTHRELVEKSGVYRNLYQHQFRPVCEDEPAVEGDA
jgi:ATP-binding cassette, subfamily B, bacterial MsbA